MQAPGVLLLVLLNAAPASSDVLVEGQSVRDVARLDLARISPEAGRAWVIGKIRPTHPGGQMKAAGAYVQSGDVISPPGTAFAVHTEGTFEVVKVLTGALSELSWRFHREFDEDGRDGLGPKGDDFLFLYGGLVVCEIDSAAEGSGRFLTVDFIPSAWTEEVVPALVAFREHRSLFGPGPGDAEIAQLERFARGENPLLAVQAYRALLDANALAAPFLPEALVEWDRFRQAAVTYLLLSQTRLSVAAALVELERIVSTRSLKEGSGIALGAFSVASETAPAAHRQRGMQLLELVRERYARSRPGEPGREYVGALLAAANPTWGRPQGHGNRR